MNEPKHDIRGEVIDLGAGDVKPITERVNKLAANVRKIAITDEGKLSITLETTAMDDESLHKVKDMLVLQQNGAVLVSMTPCQRDLFDA